MPNKPKPKRKGKRHHVHAASLLEIADRLYDQAAAATVNLMTPRDVFQTLGQIFRQEGQRVRKIVR